MTPAARPQSALAYALSLLLLPVTAAAAWAGGWALLLVPVTGWYLFSAIDLVAGRDMANADPQTAEADLFWHRLLTGAWVPLQAILVFGAIAWTARSDRLSGAETLGLFFGIGVVTGTVGLNYGHELLHQRNRVERWLGDLLLGMVFYGHFRSEHLLVHHRHVGTPRDAVTARYNEGFHRFFLRVLPQCLISAFRAEAAQLDRRGRRWWHRDNPFWRYAAIQSAHAALALALGGVAGLGLLLFQALVAVWQLELVNYVEHYGLTRRHLGGGRYERVMPHHSWNAAHRTTNWLLINLQRHSDHHLRPDRRFPLLQHRPEAEAPQLPYPYPVMTTAALIPPLWRRIMNPRVRRWRRRHYPDITDWSAYGGRAARAA
jgi:alkane 1-monooxygenase